MMSPLRTILLVAALASHDLSGAAAAPVDGFVSQLSDAGLREKVRAGWTQHGKTAKLYLGNNNIDDAGAAALTGALEKNTVLTKIYLGGNNIGDAGATALAGALEKNTVLTTLQLEGNNIGDAGNAALCLQRKRNANLELWLATLPWPLGGIDSLCKNVEKLVAKLEEEQRKKRKTRNEKKQKQKDTKKPRQNKHEQKKSPQNTKKSELRRFLSTHNMKEHFGILTA